MNKKTGKKSFSSVFEVDFAHNFGAIYSTSGKDLRLEQVFVMRSRSYSKAQEKGFKRGNVEMDAK